MCIVSISRISGFSQTRVVLIDLRIQICFGCLAAIHHPLLVAVVVYVIHFLRGRNWKQSVKSVLLKWMNNSANGKRRP